VTKSTPDKTGQKQDTRFRPGHSGNPAGRPRGSRSKFGAQYLDDAYEAWLEHGKAAFKNCAQTEPVAFIKVMASLLPKEVVLTALNVNASVSDLEGYDLSDAKEFALAFEIARQRIKPDPPMIELNPEAEAAFRMEGSDD
jgi:hypothetical protein